MRQVNIYGTDWCGETWHALQHLRQAGVPYEYVNIDNDSKAADWVKRQNDGRTKTPTLNVDGLVLSTPSDGELDTALRSKGLMS